MGVSVRLSSFFARRFAPILADKNRGNTIPLTEPQSHGAFLWWGDNPVALVRSFLHKSYKTPWLRVSVRGFCLFPASYFIFRRGPLLPVGRGRPDGATREVFAFSPPDSSGPCVSPARNPRFPPPI